MNLYILSYLAFGAVFGQATYSNRHLYSEGPTQRAGAEAAGWLNGRLFWTLLSSCLWPLLTLSGLYALWRIKVARKRP